MATRPTESSLVNDHGLLAKPLHIQRLEKALQLGPFLNHVENIFKQTSDIDDSESDVEPPDLKSLNGTYNLPSERTDPLRLYNFSKVKKERKWLKNVLLSDSSDSAENTDNSLGEHDLQEMLKLHKIQKAARKEYLENSEHLKQYQYMSVGLLSNYDKYPELQQVSSPGVKIKKAEKKNKMKRPKIEKDLYEDGIQDTLDAMLPEEKIKREKQHQGKRKATGNEASMTMKRKRLWTALAKKEISRAQKQRTAARKDVLAIKKKLAQACLRECRKSALSSQKTMKENPSKARRLTKEMLFYWKRYEKVEKEHRKKAEKEAQEQLRINMELLEAKRQQRKLNFLITQTELYAHFMSHKMDSAQPESILKSLNEEIEDMGPLQNHPSLQDNYDCEFMKALALKNVEMAFQSQQSKVDHFDQDMPVQKKPEEQELASDLPQPKMFVGKLKSYQLKGMTWLYNLYDKGINGILADEMGLGKTVQTIAFLTTLVERQGIWGPFLIVAPASTLHNWQQEFTKFVPLLKVLPYWGNTCDRKILRKFWTQKDLHTKDASFHVLITSYQLIIQDVKYFQRIKWQYLVLDEAQAIKCSSSSRWNVLLNFNCRNRLLLTGTPIQNNMAELWALLHFIMPTLFDSHAEFDEWFSKEIENHTDKNSINERHLSRLHMILKPFMLRRIKKDVENELTDKIEILKYCSQSRRQKELYQALRTKICIKDLLLNPSSTPNQSSSLMNLVMQFRKVCNHPDLFERREVKSQLYIELKTLLWPKLIYDFLLEIQAAHHLNLLFSPCYIHYSLFHSSEISTFSFTRLLRLSPSQVYKIALGGLLVRLQSIYEIQFQRKRRRKWPYLIDDFSSSSLPKNLIFTSPLAGGTYSFLTHTVICPSRRALSDKAVWNDGLKTSCFECEPTPLPKFLHSAVAGVFPRVLASQRTIYSSSLSWRHNQDYFHPQGRAFLLKGPTFSNPLDWSPPPPSGLMGSTPLNGWSSISLPDRETLVTDSGKLRVLDTLLKELKTQNHRVLIYSQMTRMIDLLEEYMLYRKHTYIRLDGSSKISERRDMVANFQSRSDIFVFLLSTRAGGLGINLTAADTVIFYDSDWNPTVDQQAMDRAHRLGQTKQVTVYRLVCKGTVEERILQRARQKSQIQQMVISGGTFKPETLKPTEVVSLLLDEEELERTLCNQQMQQSLARNKKRKLKASGVRSTSDSSSIKKMKTEENESKYSTHLSQLLPVADTTGEDSNSSSSDGPLVVDDSISAPSHSKNSSLDKASSSGRRGRGRPRGSGKRGARSTVLTTAAAEMAAAKAGTSAGFAAYGYVIPGVQPSSTPLSPSSLGSASLSKPHYPRGTRHKKTNPRPSVSSSKPAISSEPSTTHSHTASQQSSFAPRPFGFYVQQPSSLT